MSRTRILHILIVTLAMLSIVIIIILPNGLSFLGLTQKNSLNINVIGYQWYWEFDYGNELISDELNIPVGQPIVLNITSYDVIHSFSLDAYGIEETIIPGRESIVRFVAQKEGASHAICTVFCGTGHDSMRTTVNALLPADFAAWQARVKTENDNVSTIPHDADVTNNDWQRSYSDNHSTRYSQLKSINTSNVRDLEPAWKYDFSGKEDVGRKNNQATPILAGGILITPSISGHVIGLNPQTGQQVWTTKLPSPVGKRGLTGSKIDNEQIIFVTTPQGIYALRARDGKTATQIGVDGLFPAHPSVVPPVISDRFLFVATMNRGLQAFEISSGKEVWATQINSGELSPRIWSGLSYDQQSELVFIVTSDPGGLMGKGRKYEIDYSSSIIALSAKTGTIKWRFQETLHNLWDLDLAGSPIIADIKISGTIKRSVIALSKTGNVIVLDLLTGKPIYKNSISRVNNVPRSDLKGELTSTFQKRITIPQRISQTKLNPKTDFRINDEEDARYIKNRTRWAKYEEFIPPSHNYDVVLYGLHGGATRTGGALYKDTQSLIVPANHDPWILRLYKSDKVYRWIKKKRRWFNRLRKALKFEYNSDKNHKYGIIEQVYSLLPIIGRNDNYRFYCARCHGLARQGFIQSEFDGGTYFPSLIGIAKGDKFKYLTSVQSFNKVHRFAGVTKAPDGTVLGDIRDYIETADEFLVENNLLKNRGKWQLLLGRDGHPATKGPWGTITSINLRTGKRNWRIPFGQRLDKEGRVITQGDVNFGGILASAGKVVFATGTTDKFARAYDADTGKLLWEDKMPFSGSTSPMTYLTAGCQVVVFTATGGIFVGFENGLGSIIAYKDKACKFASPS